MYISRKTSCHGVGASLVAGVAEWLSDSDLSLTSTRWKLCAAVRDSSRDILFFVMSKHLSAICDCRTKTAIMLPQNSVTTKTTRALRERKPPPTPKFKPKMIRDANPDLRINPDPMHVESVPKCCGCIILSASAISPTMVQIGRCLYDKC